MYIVLLTLRILYNSHKNDHIALYYICPYSFFVAEGQSMLNGSVMHAAFFCSIISLKPLPVNLPQYNPYVIGIGKPLLCNVVFNGSVGQWSLQSFAIFNRPNSWSGKALYVQYSLWRLRSGAYQSCLLFI